MSSRILGLPLRHRFPGALRLERFAFVVLLGAAGCASPAPQSPAVFGGEGAEVSGPDSTPLEAEEDRPKMVGPCAKAPPPGQDAMLDDFEDGNHQLFKTYHREGWWFGANDGTEGATVSEFRAEKLPPGEGNSTNEMAAHFSASGLAAWGVSWGTTLSFKNDGLTCPFNASHFDGIKFRAKGPGTIVVKLSTIETSPPDNGGVCREKCWDAHAKLIRLQPEWSEFFVRWEELQQGGWGTDSRFDSTRLLALNFTAGPEHLPVDFWLDDVRFVEKGEKPVAAPAPSTASQSTAAPSTAASNAAAPSKAPPSTAAPRASAGGPAPSSGKE